MATEKWLKKHSGEFDLESVYMLDLSNQALTSLGSISLCAHLSILNLSHNQLTSVKLLAPLSCLEWLNLSSNQITSLDGLENLEKLGTIDLAGNLIDSLDSLLLLGSLYNLQKLTLSHRTSSQDTPCLTNPLCQQPSYKEFKASPHNYVPSLHWLDNELVGGAFHARVHELCEAGGACDEDEEMTSSVTPTLDALPNPLEESSLDPDHTTTEKLATLVSGCSKVTRRVEEELKMLSQQLSNTDQLT